MEIQLETNTSDPSLALMDVQKFDDGSGYRSLLVVRSGWISTTFAFTFQEEGARNFLRELSQLNATLAGEAVLKPNWDDHYLKFIGSGFGDVAVEGYLIDHGDQGPAGQSIHFCFATDQTVLQPLIRDFEMLVG
jgi:hypothetical protein